MIHVKVTLILSLHFLIIHDGVVVSVFVLMNVINFSLIHMKHYFSFVKNLFLVPQEFLFDPITKTYGDPSRRPEVRFGTVEYTATADYMARPPQPAMYLFLLDVSHNAIQTGKYKFEIIDKKIIRIFVFFRLSSIIL